MSRATRPCGPSGGTSFQASSIGPSSPARSRCRSAAGARSAGSSATEPSGRAIAAEMFSLRGPPSLAACQADS
eukprot:5684537-Alexandrium_andersonii.AAC.1